MHQALHQTPGPPGVEVHAELEVLVDEGRVLAVAEAHVLHHDHWRRDLAAVVEAEGDRPGDDDPITVLVVVLMVVVVTVLVGGCG